MSSGFERIGAATEIKPDIHNVTGNKARKVAPGTAQVWNMEVFWQN